MRRVFFVNRFFWPDHSATSQLLTDLAFHLAQRGFDVNVVTSRQLYEDSSALLVPEERINGVGVFRVWSARFGRRTLVGRSVDYLAFYASVLICLIKRCRRGDVVIFKTDPPMVSVLGPVVGKVRGIGRINWLQDVFPEVAQAAGFAIAGGVAGRLLQGMRDWSLRGASNVAVGERMRTLIEARGVRNVSVIDNWADGVAIKPLPASRNPIRDELGLRGRFIVGYSGNLGRVHETAAILEAAQRLRADASIVFVFIGGGRQYEVLRAETKRLALENVRFLPYQPRERLGLSLTLPDLHLVSLRPQFEGLVVPSKFYGIAAAGRPCVFLGDEQGEVARLIAGADCGVTVADCDGSGLASTIVDLKGKGERLEAMGKAARRLFESRFDRPVAMQCWERLLIAASDESEGVRGAA